MNILLEWLYYHQTFANKATISSDSPSYRFMFLTLQLFYLFLIEKVLCDHVVRGVQMCAYFSNAL